MEVIDYAAGASGSYCIRRMNGIFASYWNTNGWAGSGYVFEDKRIADALCSTLTTLEECQKGDALRLLFYNAMNIGALQGFPTVDQCGAWLDAICERAARYDTAQASKPLCSGCGATEGSDHNFDCPEAQD
jgi:hypothetical protein